MSDKVHHLGEYATAKEMLAKMTPAIVELNKCMDMLYKHRHFSGVCDAIFAIDGAILQLETRLPYFQKIVDNKGEI